MVNSQHQYQLLQRPFPNFRAFSLKNDFYWLLDSTNVRAQLFPHRQFSLYFLMNIETTRLQQSIIFNLYSIATYNKHLFTIILIIHVFAIFHRTTDIYFLYIQFCFGIKITKQFLFFLYISTLLLKFLLFLTMSFNNELIISFANKSFAALSRELPKIYGDIL